MVIPADSFVAVITGGASGIGYALAETALARGARVVLSDVRDEALTAAVARLRENGGDVVGAVADVSKLESVEELAEEAFAQFGEVDLLCNNAGVVSPAAVSWAQTDATWDRMIGVKLKGVINGLRVFGPHLAARGSGHILNTASSGGLAPLPSRAPYSATMHAVVGLTETLHLELQEVSQNLGASVLCPGLVDTQLGQNSAELGAIVLPPGAPRDIRSFGAHVLSAREVANAAFEAIDAGRVHVAPGDDVLPRAQARVEALISELRDGAQRS